MELYHKKINIGNKTKKGKNRNIVSENNPQKNIYIHKMMKNSQPKNDSLDFLSSERDNIHNVRSNMEDIFANDENKKKAIRYVIQLGKTKNIKKSPQYDNRLQKSISPYHHGGRGAYYSANIDNYQVTPNRTYYDPKVYNFTYNRNGPFNGGSKNHYGNTVSNFIIQDKEIKILLLESINIQI